MQLIDVLIKVILPVKKIPTCDRVYLMYHDMHHCIRLLRISPVDPVNAYLELA